MNNKSDSPSLMLIGGLSRSGTSILYEICNNHPQISLTYELRSFLKVGKEFPEYFSSLRNKLLRLNPNAPKHRRISHFIFFWRFVFQIILKGVRIVTMENVHKALENLLPKAAIVGDKYPRYLWHLDTLTSYEGGKFVIIYRDGRDVAQSMYSKIQTDWKNKEWAQEYLGSITKIAARWVKAIEIMEKYSSKIHIIRYEDFAAFPKKELDRLADYLKVDPAGFNPELINNHSIGKHKKKLTDQQIAEILEVAGPTLDRLGYL